MTEGFDSAPGSGGDAFDERAVWVVDEAGEDFFDFGEVLEGVEALGALLEFACGLGAAQKKDGENGSLATG